MTSYTDYEANDHLQTTFLKVWRDENIGWRSIEDLDQEPYIQWENTPDTRQMDDEGEPRDEKPWVQIYMRPQDSDFAAIGSVNGSGLFEETGMMVMNIFVPVKGGLKSALRLSTVCKRAFKGKRGYGDGCGITFPKVKVLRRGVFRARWYQVSVLVDFEYDEVI